MNQYGAGFAASGLLADAIAPGARERVLTDERQRRAEFAAKSKADPFYKADGGLAGKTAHGAAALVGVLGGRPSIRPPTSPEARPFLVVSSSRPD